MRRLISLLAVLGLALGLTVIVAAPASADITQPGNGATLRGTVTLAADGAYEDTCLFGGGSGPRTELQLLRSNNSVAHSRTKNGTGSFSYDLDTHAFPNGSYKVRSIERNRDGFFRCDNPTDTDVHNVSIDNFVNVTYEGATSAPQNTTATVRAKVADPHRSPQTQSGQTVRFSLSGGDTVTATTNSSGIATASLPIDGPPRSATVTATFSTTDFYRGDSASAAFAVTKNDSSISITPPGTIVHGQPTSFRATVTRDSGTGTPTGKVQFTLDGQSYGGPVDLVAGVATTPQDDGLSTGSHTVGAVYLGDGDFHGSTAANRTLQVNKAATATTLTSTGSPTVTGEPVTFTAEVAVVQPGAGDRTGDVQFNVDGDPYRTAVALQGGIAKITIDDLRPGNHDVQATYNGTGDLAASTSAVLTHGVERADTTVTLTTSNADPVAGEPLTFSADVSVVGPGAGTPSGAVQFFADDEPIGPPVPLDNSGNATSQQVGLDAGDHVITVNYAGDDRFAGATASIDQEVDVAGTTTTLSTSPNPSVVGQPVTLRAEVAPKSPATGTPGGVAQFTIDGQVVASVPLEGGAAVHEVADLARGSHAISVTYLSADPNFATSTSAEVTQQVNKAATRTVVQSSAPVSVYGQPVTFTAKVSVQAPGAGAPTGTVTFTDGDTVLGTAQIDSSTGFEASITTAELSVAQHAIVATYAGDDSFLGSNGSVAQKVNRAQTSTVLTSSANPAVSGQSVRFTAAVSPVAPGAGEPTGTVRFTVNGAPLGDPVAVEDGVATSSAFASLSPGSYRIEAQYGGDGNFVASGGELDQGTGQNVTPGQTRMTLTSDAPQAAYGDPVTFTASVAAVAPATGKPTGVVQFWEGGVLLGATSLSTNGEGASTAGFVSSTLDTGTHEIRAVYVGNYNFEGQTTTVTQVVGRVPTVTGIEAAPTRVTFGEDVTLTAVVRDALPADGAPTGTVTFTEGDTVLGTAALQTVDGRRVATITVPGLAAGAHDITAQYGGDATRSGSSSEPIRVVVDRAQSSVVAHPVIQEVGDHGGIVSARLTGVDGTPIVGEELVFTTTQEVGTAVNQICTGTTGADGVASCHNTNLMPAVIANGGFDVDFHGNANYLPATDHYVYVGGPR